MKNSGQEWVLTAVAFLMLAVSILGTMWGTITSVNERMNNQVNSTQLPTNR